MKKADKSRIVSGLGDLEIQICVQYGSNADSYTFICEQKSPSSGFLLSLLNKQTYHFIAHEDDSAFVKSLK